MSDGNVSALKPEGCVEVPLIHPNWARPAAVMTDGYSLEMTAKETRIRPSSRAMGAGSAARNERSGRWRGSWLMTAIGRSSGFVKHT